MSSEAQERTESSIRTLLERILRGVRGSEGIALVDSLGDTVEQAGLLGVFSMSLVAAHWQIAMTTFASLRLSGGKHEGQLLQLRVNSAKQSFVIRSLSFGYVLVLSLQPGRAFSVSDRAMDEAASQIALDAGWSVLPCARRWIPVGAQFEGQRGAPSVLIHELGCARIEVVGRMLNLRFGERGFRVRFENGLEATLVRDSGGTWFVDERLDALAERKP